METNTMSNTDLAALVGLSHVQVSRIRSGTRRAPIDTMIRIAEAIDWDIAEQAKARANGTYATEFEAAIGRYASTRNTDVGPGGALPDPTTD